jgi:hypothetical protein
MTGLTSRNVCVSDILAKGLSRISLAESHINPMAQRVGRINWAKITLKQQNPHGTPAFRERFYMSKMKQTLRTLTHQQTYFQYMFS